MSLATTAASAGGVVLNHMECDKLIKNEEGKVIENVVVLRVALSVRCVGVALRELPPNCYMNQFQAGQGARARCYTAVLAVRGSIKEKCLHESSYFEMM